MKNLMISLLAGCIMCIFACSKNTPSKQSQPAPGAVTNVPVTPFKTLNFLYSIQGKKTVAGIHNREPNSQPTRWTDQVFSTTGKYPALWSGDFLFQSENINNRQLMIDEAVRQYQKGALINIMWHACNPAGTSPCNWDDGKGVLSIMTDQQWNELLTDGSSINTNWKAMMNEVAVYLQQLKDKHIEVLWRPLHEMNQGKFWWGGRPGANGTKKLYQQMHDYLTVTKGLTNLIWVWDMQDFGTLDSDLKNYNPGNDYWDIAALDVYDGGYTQAKYMSMVNVAGSKPIAIGECEKLPTTTELSYQPKWTFFMGWSELVFDKNTSAEIKTSFGSETVVTLEKMPGW